MCVYGLPFRARDALEETGEEHVGGPIGAAPAAMLGAAVAATRDDTATRDGIGMRGTAAGGHGEERPTRVFVSA
ncbi:MAG TPA: hypothetical protein VNS09_15250 [Solirubrobacter sp.]|nr:hypothetical protein [Solirubrobacter sp.]